MLVLSITFPGSEFQELPSCGVMAVYTVAHYYQKDCSLQHVESLLLDGASNKTGYSLEQLRMAVRSLGFYARSVRVTSSSLDRIHCPSIIYIRPDKLAPGQMIGHFAVLHSVADDFVRVVDLTQSTEPWNIPRESLFSSWDGECLEISKTPFLIPSAGLWKVLCAFVVCSAAIVIWCSVVKMRLQVKVVVFFLTCCLVGCQEPTHPNRLISFDEATFSGGTVSRGSNAIVRCSFVVGKEKIIITSIDSECACISPDDQLVGQELLPGTAHSFIVKLDTFSRFARSGGALIVRTVPPAPEPLQCNVFVYIDSSPEPVGTLPIQMEATVGDFTTTEILLEHFRGHDRDMIEWDERRSDLASFSLVRTDFSSVPNSPTVGVMAGTGSRDLFRWTLLLPENLQIGRHAFDLKIAWKDDCYPPQRVPIEVHVRHPLRTSLDRVFFGVIDQGLSPSVDIKVTNWDAEQVRDVQVESDNLFVAAALDSQSGVIRIRLSEFAPPGRVRANVHVRKPQQSLELTIPVTAVISESQDASSLDN